MVFGLYDLLKYFFKHYALISLGDNKTLLQKAGKKQKQILPTKKSGNASRSGP